MSGPTNGGTHNFDFRQDKLPHPPGKIRTDPPAKKHARDEASGKRRVRAHKFWKVSIVFWIVILIANIAYTPFAFGRFHFVETALYVIMALCVDVLILLVWLWLLRRYRKQQANKPLPPPPAPPAT